MWLWYKSKDDRHETITGIHNHHIAFWIRIFHNIIRMRKSYIWGTIRVKNNNRNRNIAWICFLLSHTYRSSKDIFGRFDLVKLSSNLDAFLTMTPFHDNLYEGWINIEFHNYLHLKAAFRPAKVFKSSNLERKINEQSIRNFSYTI